jgi:leader peptidase (prepilin peptidase)/N-methyltransferase
LGVAGCLVGLALQQNLNRLSYRIIGPQSDERASPHPGGRWWVPAALAVAWLVLGSAYAHAGWPWLVLWLPYALAGTWLAAVDFDVHRLPDKVQIPLALYVLAAGIGLILAGYGQWLSGLIGAAACGVAFGLVHLISRHSLGFGDVKHVVIAGWCLGLSGYTMIFYGLIAACLLAIGWALVRREREFAFGPWLVLGTVIAASMAGFSWTSVVSVSLT